MSITEPAEGRLVVGYVAGAHGIRGGLRVKLHDPDSRSLRVGRTIHLHRNDVRAGSFEITAMTPVPGKPGIHRVTLGSVTDREHADTLRGCEILVDRAELPALRDDEFYLADALGLPVRRTQAGEVQALGTVVGLTSNGVQDLYEVQWEDAQGGVHPWLLPVLPHCVLNIDDDGLWVELPIGMLPDALEDDG